MSTHFKSLCTKSRKTKLKTLITGEWNRHVEYVIPNNVENVETNPSTRDNLPECEMYILYCNYSYLFSFIVSTHLPDSKLLVKLSLLANHITLVFIYRYSCLEIMRK